ncbi:MAG TPA: acyl carrier protein [Patescibacteria group bacterium]|nr:acyl carrier protein [Patescibacteria group bacterium]
MDRKQIESKMREILAQHVPELNAKEFTLDTPFSSLAIDSLKLSKIMVDMEETYGFTLSGSTMMKLKTLALTIDYIEQNVK